MNKPSKGQIGWGIVVVAMIAASLFFGVKLPIPPEPEPVVGPIGAASALSDRYYESLTVDKELDVNGTTALDGAVTMGSSLNVTGAITGGTLACTSASWPVNVVITGTTDIDGATTITGTTTLKGALAMSQTNSAGAGANPIDYTATLGAMTNGDDYTLLDINITNANHTGTTNAVQAIDIAGITADAEATESAIKIGAGWDYGLDLDGNAVVLGADGGVTLDETSDDAVTLGFGAGTGLLTVGTGNLQIGAGTPGVALNGQDAYVSDHLEVDGAATFDGTVTLGDNGDTVAVNSSDWDISTTGAMTGIGAVTADGDVTLTADSTGGNLGAKTEYIGLPRIKLIGGGQGTNPASQTIALVDDTPDGEFAPVDADVTEALSTTVVKYGTNSYAATFAVTATAGDGFLDANLGAAAAWDDMESAGLLVYSTVPWASGDLTLVLTDDGGARTYDIPALTAANTWTWLEVNIATGDLSAVSDVAILMSAAGETALGAFTMYLDIGYVWDSVDEEALGVAIQQDGILGVINTETGANLVELTDYLVHYESGVDFLVYITDQSAADIAVLAAY
jgi:hypothetical protein